MTETTTRNNGGAFADIIANTTKQGPDAERKARLTNVEVPYHLLAAHGIDVPGQTYHPERIEAEPTTITLPSGEMLHLHQDVREVDDEEFGDFGAIDTSDEDVIWTVVGLKDDIELTVVGDWSKRRYVTPEEFVEDYEPCYLADGQPRWGY
jgi:hypothetical protein